MAESKIRCPVCGTSIRPELVPTARDASFPCSRCRTQLEVTAPDPLPILAVSVLLSLGLCLFLELRGLGLVLTAILTTAVFYLSGSLLRSLLAVPKLKQSQSKQAVLHPAKRTRPAH